MIILAIIIIIVLFSLLLTSSLPLLPLLFLFFLHYYLSFQVVSLPPLPPSLSLSIFLCFSFFFDSHPRIQLLHCFLVIHNVSGEHEKNEGREKVHHILGQKKQNFIPLRSQCTTTSRSAHFLPVLPVMCYCLGCHRS